MSYTVGAYFWVERASMKGVDSLCGKWGLKLQ